MIRADIKHGTYRGYDKMGCRCAPCKRANADYMRKYRAARVKPKPERRTPTLKPERRAPEPKKKPVLGFGEEFTAFITPAKTLEQYVRDAEDATNPAFLSWLERRR